MMMIWVVLVVAIVMAAVSSAPGGRLDRWMSQRSKSWRTASERDKQNATGAEWMPCPRCGSKRVRFQQPLSGVEKAGGAVAGLFFWPLWILAAAGSKKQFHCDECRFEWDRRETGHAP